MMNLTMSFLAFPELEAEDKAKSFRQVYRHGFLHQVM
jgi:hypothetical protein